jgi:HEAT repeats
MQQQQMMMQQQAMQQQAMQQQAMYPYGYRPYGNPMAAYNNPMPSQGPGMNFSRQYIGPQAPNPFGSAPMQPAGYAPMSYPPQTMAPQYPVQPIAFQPPMAPAQPTAGQQVEQLVKVLRESPYPAQREWAAQSLAGFEWRMHPQIVPMLLQSASQDPAASVRAGCVYTLGRMQAAVEPVFSTLHSLRNDIDPRVRQEVEQAFVRLGQTPMLPQQN